LTASTSTPVAALITLTHCLAARLLIPLPFPRGILQRFIFQRSLYDGIYRRKSSSARWIMTSWECEIARGRIWHIIGCLSLLLPVVANAPRQTCNLCVERRNAGFACPWHQPRDVCLLLAWSVPRRARWDCVVPGRRIPSFITRAGNSSDGNIAHSLLGVAIRRRSRPFPDKAHSRTASLAVLKHGLGGTRHRHPGQFTQLI
jgi:hypothetical protein